MTANGSAAAAFPRSPSGSSAWPAEPLLEPCPSAGRTCVATTYLGRLGEAAESAVVEVQRASRLRVIHGMQVEQDDKVVAGFAFPVDGAIKAGEPVVERDRVPRRSP